MRLLFVIQSIYTQRPQKVFYSLIRFKNVLMSVENIKASCMSDMGKRYLTVWVRTILAHVWSSLDPELMFFSNHVIVGVANTSMK